MRAMRAGLMPLIAGFVLWSLGFVALYGLNAVGCAMGWHLLGSEPLTLQRLMLVLVLAATLAGVGALTLAQRREVGRQTQGREGLILRAGYWASLAALGATLFTFAPVFALSTCI
ncbi:hypothetical protein SAMN02983003_3467 [Devosia enhydra]|uniref:Uncharacterized protein n=1 Tax=Devosia enhydra TaxID=665118 RepID=A0A1K2I216_9HYPH|nr:hypothetical protein [Devosia enhydra]SFZ86287.1 hypothetical protein SAMN02983003_3467 [Devosia enhydra]